MIGFHTGIVKYDAMHTLHLGVLQWVCANILIELVESHKWGRFRGPLWADYALQLRLAWKRFKKWCAQAGLTQSHPQFSLTQLGLKTKGNVQREFPCLKGKASNTGKVFLWLRSVLNANPDPTPHGQLRLHVVNGWGTVMELMRSDDMFFSREKADEFHSANRTALLAYGLLAREAVAARLCRWQLKPKHHVMDEIATFVQQSLRNPRTEWTFKPHL